MTSAMYQVKVTGSKGSVREYPVHANGGVRQAFLSARAQFCHDVPREGVADVRVAEFVPSFA